MNKFVLKRFVSTALVAVMLITGCIPGFAAWDGYVEPVNDSGTKTLVDISNISTIMNAGAIPSEKYAKGDSRYSAHWNNHHRTNTLTFNEVERDWSDCNTICFDIYSEKATKATIVLMLYADYVPTPGKTISYLRYDLKLNFQGWKQYKIPTTDFTNGNYADWAKINYIHFISNGWGATPNEESDVYINSIYGILGEKDGEQADAFTMELSDEGKKEVIKSLGDNTAVMNFSNNAIIKGKVVPMGIGDKISTANGESIAPVSFFKNVLGAEVDNAGGKLKVTLDGKTADLTSMVQKYEDGDYVPLNGAMEKLGKESSTEDMVTIIGDSTKTQALRKSDTKVANLKVMLSVNEGSAKDIAKADWKQVRDNWRKFLVGDENKDVNNELVKAKLASIDNGCKAAYKKLNKDTKILSIFGDKAVAVTADMTAQYTNLYAMAKAYGTYGCEYYKDPQLKEDIIFVLEWLYDNLYGEDELANTGWRNRSEYNWHDWYVGVPTNLTESLVILYDELKPADVKRYLSVFIDELDWRTGTKAASRVYAGTLACALIEDYDRMVGMVPGYNEVLTRTSDKSGVQEDGTYITHDYFAYSTHYGANSLLDRLTRIQSILSGTKFEFATPYNYNSCMWMYETFAPITFNGAMTTAMSGRGKSSGEMSFASYYIGALVDFIGVFGKDDDIRLRQLIKRNVIDENMGAIRSYLEVDQLVKFQEIMADDTIEELKYDKSKVYYMGDTVTHQKDDIGFAITMSSTRIAGWESITGANYNGWYQGDGMLYTYLDTDPLAYDGNYWKQVNPYHLPGTTVDTQERQAVSILDSAETLSTEDFVGGAELEAKYSAVAQQLQTHNCLNENAVTTTEVGGGGDAPYHKSSLRAKKSWFLFDDEAVAVGSDINANDGFEVQTVIENRRLRQMEKIITVEEADASFREYEVKALTFSDSDGNVGDNTIDGDYSTRWSAEGDQHIIFELEKAMPIGYVGIAQYNGTDGKQAIFELETSTDGMNWTTVWAGKASGQTVNMEPYDMKGTVAKYIKYQGHGRTNSMWNSVTEIKIFAPTKDGSMPVDGNVVDNNLYGTEKITIDGEVMEKVNTYTKSLTDPEWFHIEGMSGYYMPDGGKVVVDKVLNNKTPFLEAWFTHGKSPKKGTYSYVVLPKKTAEETAAYAQNPDIEILSNTDTLHAVRENTLGATGIVFWQEGTFEDITTTAPLIMMTEKNDGLYKLGISEPSKLLSGATVTIEGNWELVECDKKCKVESTADKTVITIDFDNVKGRSLPVTLKAK